MKHNINTGVFFNAAIIVKMKKMYNNIRKIYILNMYRAFLTIDKYGRNDMSYSRVNNSEIMREELQNRPYESILSEIDKPETSPKVDGLVQINRKAALSLMSRVFKRNISKQIEKWQYNALPERRLELINTQLENTDSYNYIAKLGALENAVKLNSSIAFRTKTRAFRTLAQHVYNKRSENDQQSSFEERLELLNRQNALMEEIRAYK